ncbi:MAG: glycoside hydrolase family 3 N-terminal domain-containing protein [Myxococcota bacterium]|nr:glycoside hydrolase family 3 N-terminal domain-containing protein [Myxococcota bacterium]
MRSARWLLALLLLSPVSTLADPAGEVQEANGADPIESILSEMTLEAKISQMIMSYPPLDSEAPVAVGSVILLGHSFKSAESVRKRITSLQSRAEIPLFVATDVEGGRLNRLKFLKGFEKVPSARELGEMGEDSAREWGRKVGQGMSSLGLNCNLAPVLDVAGKGLMFESGRSMGADPDHVAKIGLAYAQGLAESGVMAIGKHYPGYGDLGENSDHALVLTNRASEKVAWHADAFVQVGDSIIGVMMANVGYNAYGGVPAILSKELVSMAHDHGWLTITDDLAIDALADSVGGESADVVRRAFLAGNDILLTTAPLDWEYAIDYRGILMALVQSNPEHVERVNESVRRILRAKQKAGLLSAKSQTPE